MRIVYPGEVWRYKRENVILDYIILNTKYSENDAIVTALSIEGKTSAITVWSEQNKFWSRLGVGAEELKACIL